MNKLFRPFKLKLVALCLIVLVAAMAAIHTAVYTTMKEAIEEQLQMGALGVAVSVAKILMENVEEYKEFIETKDVHSEYYRQMQAYFANLKANSNVKYFYTERRIDAETSEFILDADPIGSPDYSPPGTADPNDQEMNAVYSTARPIGFKLVDNPRWGQLLGAYAPIADGNGGLLGIIGVDIDGSNLYKHLDRMQVMMLSTYLLIIGLVLWILLKYSDMILEPMFRDKLTGAYNMRFFVNFIQDEIKAAAKKQTDLALMMLDLDHFKQVNDTYGHGFGDAVLTSVAKTVGDGLRKTDYFFRYGGEEFVVMIPQTNLTTVLSIAERIRAAVEQTEVFNHEKNISVRTTISIGVSNLGSLENIGANELLEKADQALYAAKEKRNTVSLFEDRP
jgi:diguanylate cyclase (GGDEF)-like protein